MRKGVLLVFTLFTLIGVQAQNLDMEDAILGRWRQYNPENLSQLNWKGSSNELTYVIDNDLVKKEIKGEQNVLLKLETLNNALETIGEKALKRFPRISWLNNQEFAFYSSKNYLVFSLVEKSIIFKSKYNDYAQNVSVNKAKNFIAYTIKNNLFYLNDKGEEIAITSDSNPNNVYGQSVSRNEFGINGGIFWSPKGTSIAFFKKDESRVSSYPLVDVTSRVAELNDIKYPMAGMPSEYVTLGIYNIHSKETVYLETQPETEEYLTNIAWGPQENFIYVAVINRAQNHMKFNKYDAKNGKIVATLFEEKNDRYVEPGNAMTFLKKQPNKFIWQSRRDGFNHLYLYDVNGKLIKQLTKGNWLVTSFIGFDAKEKYAYFVATKEDARERHLYKVSVSKGAIKKLTNEAGVHNVTLSADKKYFIDNYSNLELPRKIDICNTKGKLVKNLLVADNPYKDFNLGEIKLGELTAKDGKTGLYYRMILPADFDPSKKYPVIVYVYGGPHAQLVTNSWMGGTRMWQQYMAQRGYIAFTLDNRGSANRGFEFESVIHRNLGDHEVDDQMTGVEYLKTLPYVDSERIGVHGWSYGGFMTTSLMLKQSETFKVGVAGGPVIDWKYYEVMYGERYMDTPEENPEGYEKAALTNYIKNLKGRLMLIHGAQDPTVVWQHSLMFTRECVKEGVLIDYFPYPTHPHNVRGKDRVHLMNKVSQYFEDFL